MHRVTVISFYVLLVRTARKEGLLEWSCVICPSVCTSEISKSVALRPVWVTFHINVMRVCPCIVSVKVAPPVRMLVCAHGKVRK